MAVKCEASLPLCLYLSPKHSLQVAFGFPNHRLILELTVVSSQHVSQAFLLIPPPTPNKPQNLPPLM